MKNKINNQESIINLQALAQELHNLGARYSRIRQMILEVLAGNCCLSTQIQINKAIQEKGLRPNRSTIFRELNFLQEIGLVSKTNLEGTDYYELVVDHHHHLVCNHCQRILRIKLDNDLTAEEERLQKEYQFQITKHNLDFFGICEKCQKTN